MKYKKTVFGFVLSATLSVMLLVVSIYPQVAEANVPNADPCTCSQSIYGWCIAGLGSVWGGTGPNLMTWCSHDSAGNIILSVNHNAVQYACYLGAWAGPIPESVMQYCS